METELLNAKCQELVKDLAEWSNKYPRTRIYHPSQMSMDKELIELEERAKILNIYICQYAV